MSLPRTVADVLSEHVSLEIESIDRLYLNLYQPRLQYPPARSGSSGTTGGCRSPPPP